MDSAADEIAWVEVWSDVASRLRTHRVAGRRHLLTEDTVRMETVHALDAVGVAADRLTAEYLAPELSGGKLDLVVDPPGGVVIELKYPRDSRTGPSPDTMTVGELVRDFLRVAAVPASERWVVQLLNPRLLRYLTGIHRRHPLQWAVAEGTILELHPDTLAGLPETARRAIGVVALQETVTAKCVLAEPIDDALVLYAYRVDAPKYAVALPLAPDVAKRPPSQATASAGTRGGARREILSAIDAVTARSGVTTFTMPDIITEMRARGSGYAESTIRTMISAHLCADASGPGIDAHTDLQRVDRGLYRRT